VAHTAHGFDQEGFDVVGHPQNSWQSLPQLGMPAQLLDELQFLDIQIRLREMLVLHPHCK